MKKNIKRTLIRCMAFLFIDDHMCWSKSQDNDEYVITKDRSSTFGSMLKVNKSEVFKLSIDDLDKKF